MHLWKIKKKRNTTSRNQKKCIHTPDNKKLFHSCVSQITFSTYSNRVKPPFLLAVCAQWGKKTPRLAALAGEAVKPKWHFVDQLSDNFICCITHARNMKGQWKSEKIKHFRKRGVLHVLSVKTGWYKKAMFFSGEKRHTNVVFMLSAGFLWFTILNRERNNEMLIAGQCEIV